MFHSHELYERGGKLCMRRDQSRGCGRSKGSLRKGIHDQSFIFPPMELMDNYLPDAVISQCAVNIVVGIKDQDSLVPPEMFFQEIDKRNLELCYEMDLSIDGDIPSILDDRLHGDQRKQDN
jgi:hypothetical protein